MKRLLTTLLALFGLFAVSTVLPAASAPRTRCFSETGLCVSGSILTYWERNGGLPVFGYPISEVSPWGDDFSAQWFERDRLEDHGRLGVLAGRLGAEFLELQGRPWETLSRVDSAAPGCRFFPITGHSLCGEFLRYWEAKGGMVRFGYPISEPMDEIIGSWRGTTQYFERRRMELHPDLAGTPYAIQLGLLGRRTFPVGLDYCFEAGPPLQATAAAFSASLGCPNGAYLMWKLPIATQTFERGTMIWVDNIGPRFGPVIYVIFFDTTRNSLVAQYYRDTWFEGQPNSGGETPPAGLYEPIRGFGKVWRENAAVRNTLGWASAPEQADTGIVQTFVKGMMIYRTSVDRVYILYDSPNAGRADDIPRIP
jgi:hypothetical protein